MPRKGSISQQPERPDANKRHAKIPTTGSQHRANDVENMSVEELDWQIEKTENELLDMIRLLMRQCEKYNELTGADRDGQFTAAWIANWAHNPGDVVELNRLCEAMNDGDAQ